MPNRRVTAPCSPAARRTARRDGAPRAARLCLLGLTALIGVALTVIGSAGPVSAHPLGNFTVNRYARIEVSAGRVRIYYVLDEAEIPAFSERDAVKANSSGFARQRLRLIASRLELLVDGHRRDLRIVDQSLDQPPGQGGLRTLRVAAIYSAALPPGRPADRHRLVFADRNEPERIGWREIVTVARGDATILRSNAPGRDVSDELRHYPGDLIQAPLDLRSASLTFTPGSRAVDALSVPRSAPPPSRSGGVFADLITRQHLNPLALAGILALAFGFGASHALLPGHGKTVMAAYLVGTRGRPVDALFLGVIVSVMHTFSVLVLGLVLFEISHEVRVEQFYPQLTAASGVLAMSLGVWLLVARVRGMRRTDAARRALHDHDHDHDHEHTDHDHEAEHQRQPVLAHAHGMDARTAVVGGAPDRVDHGHHVGDDADHAAAHGEPAGHHHHHGPGGHTHELPEDVAPLSRRGLVLLATSGGIVPSPSAVIIVVAGFSLGRVGLGLSLIAAFSIGLATTLTAVGLALVFGRAVLERRFPNRSMRYLPVAGAIMLVLAGGILAAQGLTSLS